MPKNPTPRLDHSVRELILTRYFALTCPVVTPEFGKRLSDARKIAGLTQKELADRLSLSQADISRLERGKNINAMPPCAVFKSVLKGGFEKLLTNDGFYTESEISVYYNKQIKKWVVIVSNK